MLSLFPSLLSWNETSPLLIRLCLGAVLLYWSYRVYRDKINDYQIRLLASIEGIAGILLIIGLWTQAAALFVLIDLLVRIIQKIRTRSFLTSGINYYLLLFVFAISLIVTGAGLLAFDWPL